MTAAPNILTIAHARADAAPLQSLSLATRLLRWLDVFWLCRQIAVHTEAGRKPPRRLLEELGIDMPD